MANTAQIRLEITGSTKGLESAFDRASRRTRRFSAGLGTIAKASVGFLAIQRGVSALGSAIEGSIGSAVKFEESMSKIVGLVGVSRKEVDGFADSIAKIGPATGKGPQELGDAMFFITSAGLRGQKAIEALTQSARASAAGLGDTATVADAVTSAINAYASTGLTAADSVDVLTAAIREGKLEAGSLAPELGKVLPTASALDVSFGDLAGTFAVLSKTGTNAAEASTQIGAVMSSLLSTSPKVTDALASVGLSQAQLRDTAAGPSGLIGVFRQIEGAFKGNLEGMRQVIPNVRAFRAAMNALAQDGKDVDKVLEGVRHSTGAADKAFEEATKTAGFKFKQFSASLQGLGIQIGAALAPGVAAIAQAGSRAIAALGDLGPTFDRITTGVKSQLPALRELLDSIAEPIRSDVLPIVRDFGSILVETFKRLGSAVAASKKDLADAFKNIGQALKNVYVAARPTIVFLFEKVLPVALRIAIKVMSKFTEVTKLMSKIFVLEVKVITIAIEKFLGGISKLTDAASHLPFVGDKFKGISDKVNAVREDLRGFVDQLDSLDGKNVDVTIDLHRIDEGTDRSARSGNVVDNFLKGVFAQVNAADAAVKKAVAAGNKRTKDLQRQQEAAAAAAKAAAARSAKAKKEQRKAFEALIDNLGLDRDRAAATVKNFADDFKALDALETAVKRQIVIEGHTAELERQLFEIQQDRVQVQLDQQAQIQKRQQALRDKRKANQFKALGLSATGEQRLPSVGQLRTQLGRFSDAVEGTFLDTQKTQSLLGRIRRVLKGGMGAISDDVRSTIDRLLSDLNAKLKGTGDKAAFTKFRVANTDKVLAGLGLSGDALREARSRISRIGIGHTIAAAGGAGGVFGLDPSVATGAGRVSGGFSVNIYGDVVTPDSDKFLRDMQKKAQRSTRTRTGVRPGGGRV